MDKKIFGILKKICLLLFAGDIFAHAIVGASMIEGAITGTVSMTVMLALIVILYKADKKSRIKKAEKKRKEK